MCAFDIPVPNCPFTKQKHLCKLVSQFFFFFTVFILHFDEQFSFGFFGSPLALPLRLFCLICWLLCLLSHYYYDFSIWLGFAFFFPLYSFLQGTHSLLYIQLLLIWITIQLYLGPILISTHPDSYFQLYNSLVSETPTV